MSVRPQPAFRPVTEWDEATLAACRRGERAALDRVLRAELSAVEKTLGRLIASQSELADVLQTALIASVRAFPGFRGEASVRTWLTGIAIRTALDHLRSPARRRLELVRDPDPPDLVADPEHALAGRQRLDRLRAHLGAIAPKKRVAFVLHVLEGRPIEEVAALVGASRAATKSRVFFARRELVKRIGRDPALCDLVHDRSAR
jgi:RNA polymerase sigma-70 factor, ECF subfamily